MQNTAGRVLFDCGYPHPWVTKKLHVHRLGDLRDLQVILEERLHCVTAAELEKRRKRMKTTLQETTAEAAGVSTRKHRDWFDEAGKATQELLEQS